MTVEIIGDAWTFARRTYGWVAVLRNGLMFGVLSPHGTRGRDIYWTVSPANDDGTMDYTTSVPERAGRTLAEAKRWVKLNKGSK